VEFEVLLHPLYLGPHDFQGRRDGLIT